MAISISFEPINAWQALVDYQDKNLASSGKFGATSIFIGTMRDFNDNETVKSMFLEHYPGMTENLLAKIVGEASHRWRIIDSLIIHRAGEILPDDTIVLAAVWASHRGDACDACRYIVEALKSSAPFWKKERLASGESRWVENNTDGYAT